MLLLRVFKKVRNGVVWPEIVLRTARTDESGPVDGPRTCSPVRTGTQQSLCDHRQSVHGTSSSIFPRRSPEFDVRLQRPIYNSSSCDQMRREIAQNTEEFDPSTDQASGFDILVSEAATPLVRPTTTPPPVVETPRWSITPNNRSLAVLESGQLVARQCHRGCFKCIDHQHGTTNIR